MSTQRIPDTILGIIQHLICNFIGGAIIGAFAYVPLAILVDATLVGSMLSVGVMALVFGPEPS